MFKAINHVVLT